MKDTVQASPDGSSVARPVDTLCITGKVRAPVMLTINELCEMEFEEVRNLPIICGDGTPKGQIGSCKGVLLENVIRRADVIKEAHNDTKKMFIVASSRDGYKVVFSWQEIFNSPMGEGVMILVEKDGGSLRESEDGLELISASDYFTGPRIVKGLEKIQIMQFA